MKTATMTRGTFPALPFLSFIGIFWERRSKPGTSRKDWVSFERFSWRYGEIDDSNFDADAINGIYDEHSTMSGERRPKEAAYSAGHTLRDSF